MLDTNIYNPRLASIEAHRWNLPIVIPVSTSPLGHPSVLNTTRIGPIPGMSTVVTTFGMRHACTDAV